ncbi:hypothetical protein ILUMI_25878 [Ignelater luminosus]|uniref:Mpv17-like protein 2 n=1 Tax=Ignelater luminosus TaxID=2038154 RepID=A0A8K0C7L8_IGNLU|nr:hypothetical protein ILUMI_25878 [Ignelater luminosus]
MLFRLLNHCRFFGSRSRCKKNLSSRIARVWHHAFGKYLLFTNTWTSGSLMGIGDLIEQEIEYQRKVIPKRYDWARSGRMSFIGTCLGPLNHFFYAWLDKILPHKSANTAGQKIFLDQFIMSPICISFLLFTLSILEGKSPAQGIQNIRDKFIEVYTVDWCVWPPTQFINFYFLPVKYQVIYVNSVAACYSVFLSFAMHRDQDWHSTKRVK